VPTSTSFSQVAVSVSTGRNQYVGGCQGYGFAIDHVSWPDEDQLPSSISAGRSNPYSSPPLFALLDPVVELASVRPHRDLHLDRRINFSAICCGMLLQVGVTEIHI
jgi:hypothetical protein